MFELLAQARNQPLDVVKNAPYGSAMLTPAQLETYTKLVIEECAKITKEHFGVEK
jgi:hypothetical protein